jgi:hypothetical protein
MPRHSALLTSREPSLNSLAMFVVTQPRGIANHEDIIVQPDWKPRGVQPYEWLVE